MEVGVLRNVLLTVKSYNVTIKLENALTDVRMDGWDSTVQMVRV